MKSANVQRMGFFTEEVIFAMLDHLDETSSELDELSDCI